MVLGAKWGIMGSGQKIGNFRFSQDRRPCATAGRLGTWHWTGYTARAQAHASGQWADAI